MSSQRGFAPILILLAAAGIILYLLLSSSLPFKDKLFSLLYPKPSSYAQEARKNYDQLVKERQLKPVGKILQADLIYDVNTNPNLSVKKISRKNSYLPEEIPQPESHQINLFNIRGELIYWQKFVIPNFINDPPPLPGKKATSYSKLFDHVTFSVNLPFFDNAASLQIVNAQGTQILTHDLLSEVEDINNKPDFHSIGGTDVVEGNQNPLQRLLNKIAFPSVFAAADGYLDIAIISEDYTDMSAFHLDADEIISHALTYEPFRTRTSELRFNYVDNTADLGCKYDEVVTWLLYCDHSLVLTQVNNSGVPFDLIYTLVNNPAYGGSGNSGGSGTGYNGTYKEPMFVHELLGHAFGKLRDEFIRDTSQLGIIDNQTHSLVDNDGNCYAGPPPAQEWTGLINLSDYYAGCQYPNWYRPSDWSVMSTLSTTNFNTPSQAILGRRLDYVTAIPTPTPTPQPDIAAPSVSITSPENQATISGIANIAALASDNTAVTKVEFYIAGQFYEADLNTPYVISWDTTVVSGGTHDISAKAYDGAGNVGQSSVISVTVNNPTPTPSPTPTPTPSSTSTPSPTPTPADTTLPSVSITNPANGSIIKVNSTVNITASASDNVKVSKVEFYVNNSLKCTSAVSPYTCSWRVPRKKNASYTITTKAYDPSNNTNSSTITVKAQ